MRFAVVTPARNAGSLIFETVQSIVNQSGVTSGRHEIDYIIWDGHSEDDTAERAALAADGLATVHTQSDKGMYDALGSALAMVDGDVYFYLNAGDILLPGAFDAIASVYSKYEPDWICGMHVHLTAGGQLRRASVPLRYRQSWISRGVYGTALPFIQQESTFWSSRAMSTVDLEELRTFRLAGDFYLWRQFSYLSEPLIVEAGLGGYRDHADHLGDDKGAYFEEMSRVTGARIRRNVILPRLESGLWHLPPRIKSRLNPRIVRSAAL